MTSHASTAIEYAQQYGWAVHPVDIEKKPTTKHGRNDATRDEQQIRRYFKNGAQIGVATGPESGLFVLDIDLDEQKGINGYETLAYLESVHGQLPPTPRQRTGRGGMQYLFKYVDGLKNSTGKIGAGIDTRGAGGYIVAAPSRNTRGAYEWIVSPAEQPLADVPKWIIDALKEAETATRTSATASGEDRTYCLKMLGQAVARVATASDGQKHDTLLKMARWMGGFVPMIAETEIESALWSAVSLRAEDERGARKTIQDGIAYGKNAPLDVPAQRQAPANVDPATGEIVEQKKEYVVDWRSEGVTAAQLQQIHFPPRVWVVDSIMSIGATVLGGKSKSKKSWLALNCAVAVSCGGRAMGQLEVTQGRVLYLDLESNQQRMKERLQAILGNRPWPENLHIFTKWPRGEEGIQRIDSFCTAFGDVRYIVVDILQNIRPPRVKNANPYDEDYEAVKALNQCAERNGAGMHILHHTRKAKADDVFDELSGTMGLTGGVAGMWVLSPVAGEKDASTLSIRGRDIINDDPIALTWDAYLCQHTIAGTAAQYAVSHERRAILEVMEDDQEHTASDLAKAVNKSVNAVTKILISLAGINAVEKTGHGKYAIVRQNRQNRQNRQSGQNRQSLGQNDSAILPSILPILPTASRDMAESFWSNETPHNVSSQTDSAYSAIDSIGASIFDAVPAGQRTVLRVYLQSNKESDQETARERCEQYGIDYDAALAEVKHGR